MPFFFRLDGLPEGWIYQITPERPVLNPDQTINAQITLQPLDAGPLCSREEVTLTAFARRVDTLKRAGAITLAVSLKSPASVTHESWTDCDCDCPNRGCQIYTGGCTNQPNTRIAVTYQDPTGATRVQYVTTDDEGCFSDILPFDGIAGTWETNVVVEESECTDGATSKPVDVTVRPEDPDRCPDLIVEEIDRPRFDGDTGESVITAVIRNVGKDTAGASISRLVDPSTRQPTGAPYNATAAVGELQPCRRQIVEFRLPYWIYNPDALAEVTADYKNMVQECDEENNKAVFRDIG